MLAVTPADVLAERSHDVFCERGVLAAIDALADSSHSKTIADLVTAGTFRPELLTTLGKVASPRYAHFIGRYKDDRDAATRRAVAAALGLVDNEAVAVPVLIQLLARGGGTEDFLVRWEAGESLVKIGRRKGTGRVRQRLLDLLAERDRMTAALAARALARLGDARGVAALRALTRDGDARVRGEAVLALGELQDPGSGETLMRRLTDESLAVRACAVYALGRVGGPSIIPSLRKAVEASTDYERELEQRRQGGESEAALRERYGLGAFDLRETLQEAMAASAKPPRPTR
jgi:HEAT repeat protein